jgi:hypothetical protein
MTTLRQFSDINRDNQDGTERHVWDEQTFTDAGSIIRVRGTGTQDEEAVVVNNGIGMQLPKGTNTEVFLLAGGADTNQKYAMLSIPRDKQRKWKEGTNGIQFWNDPSRALEINDKRSYVDDANFATRSGVLEVIGDTVYIRGKLMVSQDIGAGGTFQSSNVPQTPLPAGGTAVVVPGFEE